jgi:hypothetical protein
MAEECRQDIRDWSCGEPLVYAADATYGNSRMPIWSELTGDERCDTVSEALRELYKEADRLKTATDLTDAKECLQMDEDEALTISGAIDRMAGRLCDLKDRFAALVARYNGLPVCACEGTGVETCY